MSSVLLSHFGLSAGAAGSFLGLWRVQYISPSTVRFNIRSYFGCPLTGLESYASAITASTSVLAIVQPRFAFHFASSIGRSTAAGELASALNESTSQSALRP